jgi:hypothetical protein
MAHLCCAGSNSLAIFVLKLREFTSSRLCDRGEAPFHDAHDMRGAGSLKDAMRAVRMLHV